MNDIFWGYAPYDFDEKTIDDILRDQMFGSEKGAKEYADSLILKQHDDLDDWETAEEDGYIFSFEWDNETGDIKILSNEEYSTEYTREPSMESQHGLTLSDLV